MVFFGCSEVNSTWLITSELANQRARKVLFTCVVYTKHIYLVCCCQRTIAMIDISFRAIFPFEQELRAARVSSVAGSAHLLRSIFLFEPVLRAARAFYRKHFWCFSTFRTKNTHIYRVCFTYIMFSLSKNYKSHSTVLQSCLLLT